MNNHMTPRNQSLILLAFVATLVAAALPVSAFADGSDAAPTSMVKFGDLDLSRPEGAATLYRRIQGAAEQVCRQYEGRPLTSYVRKRACEAHAIEVAVTTVNSPKLTALFLAKHHKNGDTRLASSK